jgi:RNA polymerase sigma factor (TIGR02999 family)
LPENNDISGLLARIRAGDRQAIDRLMPIVYQELRVMARRRRHQVRRGGTLGTTSLVHEAYLKLCDQRRLMVRDRAHFFAVAALAMRQIAVDRARRCAALKRGGGQVPLELDDDLPVGTEDRSEEILAVEEALGLLAAMDPRLAQVVELRFFGGLSVEEVGEVVGKDPRTVRRDWRKAKALLFHWLEEPGDA